MRKLATEQSVNGIRLGQLVIPLPCSISTEAQARLRAALNNGIPANAAHVLPKPEDHAAKRALRLQADTAYRAALATQGSKNLADLRTVQVGTGTVHIAMPPNLVTNDAVYIDIHGGAFVFGGGEACRMAACAAASLHGARCDGVDYRMLPEYPYPAALDDCFAAYRHVLAGCDNRGVVIGGRSAGGNLALATVLRARGEGLPLPAALVFLSPEIDLTESGDSFQTNQGIDFNLPDPLMPPNLLYAAGADLTHPRLSPLFGTFSADFPPSFIQTGTRDLVLSNAVRLHRIQHEAGAPTELHVFEAMSPRRIRRLSRRPRALPRRRPLRGKRAGWRGVTPAFPKLMRYHVPLAPRHHPIAEPEQLCCWQGTLSPKGQT
ncbi:alpha/beta hydrolase [Paracoccus nototheniae]